MSGFWKVGHLEVLFSCLLDSTMASNTSLVSVDASDSAITLNEFISHFHTEESVFLNETKALVDGQKTEQLIDKYLQHTDDLFSLDNEKGLLLRVLLCLS